MQAVILAAGKGTRMGDLTSSVPKPLLILAGKNLIEHKLDALPPEISEVVLVISYMGEAIRAYFGNEYKGRPIRYVDVGEPLGTAHAVWSIQDQLRGRFIVMMGDDIYSAEDMADVTKYPYAMKVKTIPGFLKAGNIVADEQGNLKEIRFERERVVPEVLSDIGLYSFEQDIFKYEPVKIPGREEWGLPHTLAVAAQDIQIKVLPAKTWIKINSSEDLAHAKRSLEEAPSKNPDKNP